jgi:hypothetical protein
MVSPEGIYLPVRAGRLRVAREQAPTAVRALSVGIVTLWLDGPLEDPVRHAGDYVGGAD